MSKVVEVFFLGPIGEDHLRTHPIYRAEKEAEEHRDHCQPHVRDGTKIKVLKAHVDPSRISEERVPTEYLKSLNWI